MQPVEKWRIQELMLVLEHLTKTLRSGNHTEWANVFEHYHYESSKILTQYEVKVDELKRLVQNIKNCFTSTYSFKNMNFPHTEQSHNILLNQKFQYEKARLYKLLEEFQERLTEYIH